jgi:DNA-binding response OmpR family regulator
LAEVGRSLVRQFEKKALGVGRLMGRLWQRAGDRSTILDNGPGRGRMIGAQRRAVELMAPPVPERTHHAMIVEPDAGVRREIHDLMENDGFHVTSVGDGMTLFSLVPIHHPDLVILALDLPEMSGLEVIRRLQAHGRIPAIVVSSRDSETDRVVGLELGADDYLVKPFSGRELLARVHAVLRRVEDRIPCERLDYGDLVIDLSTRDVLVEDTLVELTALEFDLLAFLASHPRQVFPREALLDRVWDSSRDWQSTATVSEHVYRVRRKIERDPAHPRWVTTVRGVGYRFCPWPDECG